MKTGRWYCCALLSAFCIVLMLMPQLASALIWRRDVFSQGQWWLALTAHCVHLDNRHLLFNLLGLFLLCELCWDQLSIIDAVIVMLTSAVGVSVLLWLLQPAVFWYAGLSGMLHGLWAGFAGAGWLRQRSVFFALVLLALLYKLLLMPEVVSTIPVVHVAHIYGAWAGLFGLLLIRVKQSVYKLD